MMISENTWNVTCSHRKCEIIKRCLTAVKKMKGVTATMTSEITWNIKSSTSDGFYTVHLSKTVCDCRLRCPTCGACLLMYMYVCSRVDHGIHYTVCKHTHLVHLQQNEEEPDDGKFQQYLFYVYYM